MARLGDARYFEALSGLEDTLELVIVLAGEDAEELDQLQRFDALLLACHDPLVIGVEDVAELARVDHFEHWLEGLEKEGCDRRGAAEQREVGVARDQLDGPLVELGLEVVQEPSLADGEEGGLRPENEDAYP